MSRINKLQETKESMSDTDLFRLEDPFMTKESIPHDLSEPNISQNKGPEEFKSINEKINHVDSKGEENLSYLQKLGSSKLNNPFNNFGVRSYNDKNMNKDKSLNKESQKNKSIENDDDEEDHIDDFINLLG
ncbi:hypothetical protein KGF54_004836 [Candida jiufengensis]|uniref:uncharacterized protein n=1 Tax=Candida jiufengensis TaxID=497108 RepID=UPI002223FAB9|nr:uncharacterized protein KGF54_004836 [Candida jiufengensis]KAI5951761.1 hypothetical protein KGF54_004836 [Candida jiufengensis]